MVVFKDKHASIGRIKPRSEKTTIPAKAFSRSLDSLSKEIGKERTLPVEILENGYMIIHTKNVIGDKIKVSKTNALKLAEWIGVIYAAKRTKRKAAKENE